MPEPWNDRIRAALRAAGHDPDDDIVEELAQHAALVYEECCTRGASSEEADFTVQACLREWVAAAPSLTRRARHPSAVVAPPAGTTGISAVLQDTRYAFRLLRRHPGAAVLATLTMALGIGATTVLFSVTWGVLLKPLPWPEAERLVRLSETRQGSTRQMGAIFTNGTYLAWQDGPGTIDGLAGWSGATVTMTGPGEPQRVRISAVTPSLFSVLRARPEIGSVFAEGPGAPLDETAIVISHGLWQQQFGGAADVPGRVVRLDGEAHTIVGVMPKDFSFPDRDTRAWTPFRIHPVVGEGNRRSLSMFSAIARLKPGVTAAQAAQEATARGRAGADPGLVAMAVFGSRGPVVVSAVPLLDAMTQEVRPALLVLLAAVGLLLVTATANVASVQLARATTRRREIAIRSALGAGTGRIARQLLVENLVLGVLGGLLGLSAAWLLQRALPSILPSDFPRVADVAIDLRVLAFSSVTSILSALAFGLAPALHARRVNLVESLASDGSAPVGGSARRGVARTRSVIMAGQVAVACTLLVGASLLVRSFLALLSVDRGYTVDNVLTGRLPLSSPTFSPDQRRAIVVTVLERLQSTPGVTQAAFTSVLPLTSTQSLMAFTMPPATPGGDVVQVQAGLRIVSAGYFEALGIRMLQGRGFTSADTRTSRPVVVVNRAFASRYLGQSPLGRELPELEERSPLWQVIGIAEDMRMRSVTDGAQPEIFLPFEQVTRADQGDPTLVVRTRSDPAALVPVLRSIVRDAAPSLALDSVETMEQRLMGSLARPRLYAVLLTGFAACAIVIAAVGLFGVLSYTVAQRSREIAVRSALGATSGDIVRLVLRQALGVAAAGLAGGMAGAAVLARVLGSFLYGVSAHDPLTFVAVPVVLLFVSLFACAVPARRAARVDPLQVMRG